MEATQFARELIAEALEGAKATGECGPDVDPELAAAQLIAYVEWHHNAHGDCA